MNYEQKYLKYKAKYIQAKQEGGGGNLRVFFLTQGEFDTIKKQNTNIAAQLEKKKGLAVDYTNISYPGLAIHNKTKSSGFEKKFPYINEHEKQAHYNGKKILFTDGTKFDYYVMKDLDRVVKLISASSGKENLNKMILVRDYLALHDVFVASFTIVREGDTVTSITIDPIDIIKAP